MWDTTRYDLVDLYDKYKPVSSFYGIPYHESMHSTGRWLGFSRKESSYQDFVEQMFEGLTNMYDELEKSAGYGASVPQGLTRRATLREEIEMQVKSLEKTLENKRELLKLLNENPAIERFMDLSRG